MDLDEALEVIKKHFTGLIVTLEMGTRGPVVILEDSYGVVAWVDHVVKFAEGLKAKG